MRVIAGKARRLNLKTVPGLGTRPTTDRIKETLFNILQPDIPGSSFLDLFAGSGGIGIEALSRGAACCVFVDNDPKAVSVIRENLAFTRLDADAQVLGLEVQRAISSLQGHAPFTFIFMDPPYHKGLEPKVLELLYGSSLLDEETTVIIEADLNTEFSWLGDAGYELVRTKTYKTNKHIFVMKRK